MFARVEVAVKPEFDDPEARVFIRKLELAHPTLRKQIRWCRTLKIYWLEVEAPRDELRAAIGEIFHDPVTSWLFTGDLLPSAAGPNGTVQDLFDSAPFRWGKFWGLEKRFRPGVTDNAAQMVVEAFQIVLGQRQKSVRASSGELVIFDAPDLTETGLSTISRDVFCNELIESWNVVVHEELKSSNRFHPEQIKWDLPRATTKRPITRPDGVVLAGKTQAELTDLSKKRLWALNAEEMLAIQAHFAGTETQTTRRSLGLKDPTDVELEVLAQTWSEHCKHKIFNAEMNYKEAAPVRDELKGIEIPAKVTSLFKTTIAGVTEKLPRPWLLSVFKDNAGIIGFDEEDAVCVKVETHNSPSALDPYGGALTGIVGVNRDILGCGRGARPIFNTNVFCLARPDFGGSLPERTLHPRRILDGVRRGVEHGGNKSGIPTVAGALYFDPRFLGKPLVFCGTGGIMPRRSAGIPCELKEIAPGDRIASVGGRVGKDGIHGATFSSLALDDQSPTSAVQLGDPFTQKRVADFLLDAREKGLFRTLTDNGAGGLSSSVGELARLSNGARLDVSLLKTKVPGLKPFELVISESQERMTVAVPPEWAIEFERLAELHSVEVSWCGEFNSSGRFDVYFGPECVGSLDLGFLHDGCPQLKLDADWKPYAKKVTTTHSQFEQGVRDTLLALLRRPNIASKEWMIRQYDHEVQATSVIKPLHQPRVGSPAFPSGPNDGAVIKPKPSSLQGLVIACGLAPKLSDFDPYLMAQAAVDEAVRNGLAVGSNYGKPEFENALVDNFCWPDPVNNPQFAAALVRTCFGLRDACLKLEIPLVSGKDSMKNDARVVWNGKEVTISVVPTLLMTYMGKCTDTQKARSADFKSVGDYVYWLGGRDMSLVGSELHLMKREECATQGISPDEAVVPTALKPGSGQNGDPRFPTPNWDIALKTYRWLGAAEGKLQTSLRSVHDVSEGGFLVTVAESVLATGLGVELTIPFVDPWVFCFGEGFHGFCVSVAPLDAQALEAEWVELRVPFLRVGTVTAASALEIKWNDSGTPHQASLPTEKVEEAWRNEGFWE